MSSDSVSLIGSTLIVKDKNSYIVYNPGSNKITRINEYPEFDSRLYCDLKECGFFGDQPDSTKPDLNWSGFMSLTLLLTRKCNLACSYCYASAKPDGEEMSVNLALNSTKWFLSQLKHDAIWITFHGGGEPTLAMETMKAVVNFVEANKKDKRSSYIITTNGTAQKDEWDWMMGHHFGISISLDGAPDIQNKNRPLAGGGESSGLVEKNIRYLVSKEYPFSIRVTYSPVYDMEEMFSYFASLGIKKIHPEPLFPYGRLYQVATFGKKSGYTVYAPEGGELLPKFLKAIKLAKKYGIIILNGHFMNFTSGSSYFCGAASARAMVVTHDGFLTGCLEVVDRNAQDFSTFYLGRYDSEKHDFEIDAAKIKMMQDRHAANLPHCKDCYAQHHCNGGCAVKAVRGNGDFLSRDLPYCSFTKALIPILVRGIATSSNV